MRDYIKEMLATWTAHGEQGAYVLAGQLLRDIRNDVIRLQKQESAIQALGAVLREHPDVDTSTDPTPPDPDFDMIEPSERPKIIVEAANDAYWERENDNWSRTGDSFIKAQEVLDHIRRRGLDLGVQQPLAVIGTVLSSAEGFHRIARNTFEVLPKTDTPDKGNSQQSGYGSSPQSGYGSECQSGYGFGGRPIEAVDDLPF